MQDPITIQDCIDFHGHVCGGISLGFVLANFAMQQLGAVRGDDLYARMECQNCLVDAVQCVTGCTTGKRNLELIPGGPMALTLVRRETGKGVRAVISVTMPEGLSKAEAKDHILALDPASICTAEEAFIEIPPKA